MIGKTPLGMIHRAGVDLGLHLGPGLQRNRVGVGQDLGASQTVHGRESRLRQIHSFRRQWQQMLPIPTAI